MHSVVGHALQVEEAAGRVAKLRAEVPADLSKHFKARLQACRPLAVNAVPDVSAAQPGGDEALPSVLSPAPAELRGKLSGAATQLPILRCACLPCVTAGTLTMLLAEQELMCSLSIIRARCSPMSLVYHLWRGTQFCLSIIGESMNQG